MNRLSLIAVSNSTVYNIKQFKLPEALHFGAVFELFHLLCDNKVGYFFGVPGITMYFTYDRSLSLL